MTKLIGIVFIIALWFACLGAWGTHVVTTIMHHQWFLLLAGAIAFPVGIIHGVGIWFGVW